MDMTKVSELVKAFEQLTPEERALALQQMLPTAGAVAWGEQAASLIESLDLGDYSDVEDSVEWIRRQRDEQTARRLGHQGS